MYAQSPKIRMSNNIKTLGESNLKKLNMIAKKQIHVHNIKDCSVDMIECNKLRVKGIKSLCVR